MSAHNERERWAKEALIDLQREYRERAQPFIDVLAQIEAFRPPPPIMVDISGLAPEFIKSLGKGEVKA